MRKLFPSQLDNEKIYIVVREHWFHLLLKLIVWFGAAAVLAAFKILGPTYVPGLFTDTPGIVTSLFVQVYVIFLLLSLFIILVLYYLNIQIVTDLRVVDITQEGLFDHTVSELHIDKIEDATSETTGVFGTIFGYGMVYVQTAGTKERFEFENVPNPAGIEKLILSLYERNSNFAKEGNESDPAHLTHE